MGDQADTTAFASLLPCLLPCPQVSDGLMGGCQGVMRGCGRQVSLMINTIVVSVCRPSGASRQLVLNAIARGLLGAYPSPLFLH